MTVFLVLPALNEEANLESVFKDWEHAADAAGRALHVILANDGSTDGTAKLAGAWASRLPLDLIVHKSNHGLGASIHDGLERGAKLGGSADVIVTIELTMLNRHRCFPRCFMRSMRVATW